MILNQKETTFAYRCPHCGAAVVSMVGAFALNADMLRLKCPCGKSEAEIVYGKDKKLRLSVPCFLCPTPHRFTVPHQSFFGADLLRVPCGYSGADVCFAGKKDQVLPAVEESGKELEKLLAGVSVGDLAEHRGGGGVFSDPQIMDIVMYVIHELQAEGEISCRCEEGQGELSADILDECVRISCRKCGAKKDIPTDRIVSANAFLHCTHIDLE